jgi:hypothetical protein
MSDVRTMRWLAIVLLLAPLGCKDSDLDRHTKQLRNEKKITVLEGLPHQSFEREVYEREIVRSDVRRIIGLPFYEGELKIDGDDLNRLRQLLGNPRLYKKFSGDKACGGFHPDYAVGASNGWTLLCFGCEEARLDGDHIHARHDIPRMDEVRAVLTKYRDKRPEVKE